MALREQNILPGRFDVTTVPQHLYPNEREK
jgi:hypothetical protein